MIGQGGAHDGQLFAGDPNRTLLRINISAFQWFGIKMARVKKDVRNTPVAIIGRGLGFIDFVEHRQFLTRKLVIAPDDFVPAFLCVGGFDQADRGNRAGIDEGIIRPTVPLLDRAD